MDQVWDLCEQYGIHITRCENGMTGMWYVLQGMHRCDQDWTGITRYETGMWHV